MITQLKVIRIKSVFFELKKIVKTLRKQYFVVALKNISITKIKKNRKKIRTWKFSYINII